MRIKEKKVGQLFKYRTRILDTVAVQHDEVIGWNGKCINCHFINHPPYKFASYYAKGHIKDYENCAYKHRCVKAYRTDDNNVIFKSVKKLTNN